MKYKVFSAEEGKEVNLEELVNEGVVSRMDSKFKKHFIDSVNKSETKSYFDRLAKENKELHELRAENERLEGMAARQHVKFGGKGRSINIQITNESWKPEKQFNSEVADVLREYLELHEKGMAGHYCIEGFVSKNGSDFLAVAEVRVTSLYADDDRVDIKKEEI